MLSELGLTGYEEKTYRALLAGASAPKEISRQSGVPPTAVYPAVQSLVEKELVQEVSGTTKLYEAINPKIGVHQLVQKRIKRLQETEKQLVIELQHTVRQTEEKSPITLSRGTVSSIAQSFEMMSTTKKTFYILGWNFNSLKSVHQVSRKLKDLKKRNIDVRVLFTHSTEPGDIFRKNLDQLHIPYKFIRTGYISLVITDGQKCKITLKQKKLIERINMVIEDTDLAQSMQQYYLTLWKKGKTA